MIIDSSLQFAHAQSVAGAAGVHLIGDQVDSWAVGTLDGKLDGADIGLVIMIGGNPGIITAGSAGTIRFQLASGTSAAIPTDGTAAVLFQTPDFATGASTLPTGTILFSCNLPKSTGLALPAKRFLGILAVVGGATITAGAIEAFLTEDVGRWAPDATVLN